MTTEAIVTTIPIPPIRAGAPGPQPQGKAKRIDRRLRGSTEWLALAQLIGAGIRRARTLRDLSQAELAAALGVSHEMTHRWESGARTPALRTLLAISLAIGCSLHEIVPTDVRGVVVVREGIDVKRELVIRQIDEAMHAASGNRTVAARQLGWGRATLRKRIRLLDLTHWIDIPSGDRTRKAT